MTDPELADRTYHRAGHPGMGRPGHRAGAARRAAAHDGRPDGAQRGDGADRDGVLAGYGVELIGADCARHPHRRGPRGVRPGHGAARPGHAAGHARSGASKRRWRLVETDRVPGHHPAVVHPGRHRRGDRLQPGGVRGAGRSAGLELSPVGLGAGGAQRHRLEGIRAGGDARRRGQCGDRLLDRERRPHGRAHRRLDHRGPRHDAHRPGIPADARRGLPDHPRGRRRGGRLQHPVRGETRPRASSWSSR